MDDRLVTFVSTAQLQPSFTASMRIQPDHFNDYHILLNGYINADASNRWSMGIHKDTGQVYLGMAGVPEIRADRPLPLDRPTLVTMERDAQNIVRIFYDSELVAQGLFSGNFNTGAYVGFGQIQTDNQLYGFQGKLSAFFLYDTALTTEQVAETVRAVAAPRNTSTEATVAQAATVDSALADSPPTLALPAQGHLLAYARFVAGTFQHPATLRIDGGPLVTDEWLSFQGVDDRIVTDLSTAQLQLPFTASMRIQPDHFNDYHILLNGYINADASNRWSMGIHKDTGQVYLGMAGVPEIRADRPLPLDRPTLVTVQRDAQNIVRIFYDGEMVAQGLFTGNFHTGAFVGFGQYQTANQLYGFQGKLSAFFLYGTVLTAEELHALQASVQIADTTPVGSAATTSGETYGSTEVESPAATEVESEQITKLRALFNEGMIPGWKNSGEGQPTSTLPAAIPDDAGRRFDGADDFIDAGTVNQSERALSISVWVRMTEGSMQRVIAKETSDYDSPFVIYANGGRILFFTSHPSPTNEYINLSFGDGLRDGRWHHLMVRYDGTRVQLTTDGVAGQSATWSGIRQSAEQTLIGATVYGGTRGYYFRGDIDQPLIFARTLGEEDVVRLSDRNALAAFRIHEAEKAAREAASNVTETTVATTQSAAEPATGNGTSVVQEEAIAEATPAVIRFADLGVTSVLNGGILPLPGIGEVRVTASSDITSIAVTGNGIVIREAWVKLSFPEPIALDAVTVRQLTSVPSLLVEFYDADGQLRTVAKRVNGEVRESAPQLVSAFRVSYEEYTPGAEYAIAEIARYIATVPQSSPPDASANVSTVSASLADEPADEAFTAGTRPWLALQPNTGTLASEPDRQSYLEKLARLEAIYRRGFRHPLIVDAPVEIEQIARIRYPYLFQDDLDAYIASQVSTEGKTAGGIAGDRAAARERFYREHSWVFSTVEQDIGIRNANIQLTIQLIEQAGRDMEREIARNPQWQETQSPQQLAQMPTNAKERRAGELEGILTHNRRAAAALGFQFYTTDIGGLLPPSGPMAVYAGMAQIEEDLKSFETHFAMLRAAADGLPERQEPQPDTNFGPQVQNSAVENQAHERSLSEEEQRRLLRVQGMIQSALALGTDSRVRLLLARRGQPVAKPVQRLDDGTLQVTVGEDFVQALTVEVAYADATLDVIPEMRAADEAVVTVALLFQFPIGDPQTGSQVTQQFGMGFDELRGHLGTDFRGSEGTPVYSVADGKVTRVENAGPGWGNIVIIEHKTTGWGWDKDVYSMYAHMGPAEVYVGQQVHRGERIGMVGPRPEGSTAAHLHFEIRSGEQAWWNPGPGYRGLNFDRAVSPTIMGDDFGRAGLNWHDPYKVITENLYSTPAIERGYAGRSGGDILIGGDGSELRDGVAGSDCIIGGFADEACVEEHIPKPYQPDAHVDDGMFDLNLGDPLTMSGSQLSVQASSTSAVVFEAKFDGWNYGFWCGPNQAPAEKANLENEIPASIELWTETAWNQWLQTNHLPSPVDDVDRACMKHDLRLGLIRKGWPGAGFLSNLPKVHEAHRKIIHDFVTEILDRENSLHARIYAFGGIVAFAGILGPNCSTAETDHQTREGCILGELVIDAIPGIGTLADARDVLSDLQKWEWSLEHAGRTVVDIVDLVIPGSGPIDSVDTAVELFDVGMELLEMIRQQAVNQSVSE